ncbi:LBF_2804 family protein [Thioalkalivibrio paradoxus]|uniref:Uncharacterized protein n=1 Tax=Thioalkalivibrio paradoxus ARh 1 TaxID=713585 RepID=W0DT67_9GAMM|nr:hypothetical protein [Thioalkalivibrio paradoxus]AHF00071.1 hypothetical protein THITH_08475 [Thioalkalivibrio paradoxus ARh 1]
MESAQSQSPELNLIERIAVSILRRQNSRDQPEVHRWPAQELAQIRRLERSAVLLAALSGMISGALIGGLEVWLNVTMPDASESWARWIEYWVIFLAGSILVSVVEILFLYWVVLRRVARITSIAGLHLSEQEIDQVIAIGLSRSALDMPDPRQPIYGIDPYARVPRWRLIAYAILYRLKIGATSFITRVLLRRVLARAAVRVFIPLIAIVIYAVWNAIIIGWVMRASRVRAAGPLAVQELGQRLQAERTRLDEPTRRLLLEAVAEAIQSGGTAHPNLQLLLGRLFQELAIPPGSLTLDWAVHHDALADLPPEVQDLLLALVTVTTILDGRPRRAQKRFLKRLYAACGRRFDARFTATVYRDFFHGQGIGALRGEA